MPISDWSFLAAIAIVLLTPGPTNTLLAASGIGLGWRRAQLLLPFEALGYLIATSLWGWVVDAVASDHPQAVSLIKLVSGLYIGMLGVKLWRSARRDAGAHGAPVVGGGPLFLATLLNPKAAVFGMALLPPQTWDSLTHYAVVMACFIALVVAIGSLWIALGAALMNGRIGWLAPQRFQRGAALILGGFAIWLVVGALLGW